MAKHHRQIKRKIGNFDGDLAICRISYSVNLFLFMAKYNRQKKEESRFIVMLTTTFWVCRQGFVVVRYTVWP